MDLAEIIKKISAIVKYSGFNSWLVKLCILFVIVGTLCSYLLASNYIHNIHNQLVEETNIIDRHISALYQGAYQLSKFVSHQIVNENYKDIKKIGQLLQSLNNVEIKGMRTSSNWPFMGWIDTDGKMVVHQHNSILQHPVDMTSRSYFQEGKKDPGKIKFSFPDYGLLEKRNYILPAGFGVTNAHGDFIGMISLTLPVSTLIDDLVSMLSDTIKFMVCDDKQNLYLAADVALVNKYRNIHNIVGDDIEDIGITNMIYLEDDVYLYAMRGTMLPINIFVGYNKYKLWKLILQNIGLILCTFFIISIVGILLMFYTASIVIQTLRSTEDSQKQFIRDINSKFSNIMLSISSNCQIILDLISTVPNSLQNKIEVVLRKIINSGEYIYSIFNHAEFKKVDLNSIINDAIQIKWNDILSKGVHIETSLARVLPNIFVDPLIMKQILISLISRAIEFSRNSDHITITTYSEEDKNDVTHVYMIFEDKGLGLNDDDMIRIQEKFNMKPINNNIGYEYLDFECIAKLIEINNGKCFINHNFGHGNIVHVNFKAYINDDDTTTTSKLA